MSASVDFQLTPLNARQAPLFDQTNQTKTSPKKLKPSRKKKVAQSFFIADMFGKDDFFITYGGNNYDWSDRQVIVLHEHLLLQSLRQLRPNRSSKEQEEAMGWILAIPDGNEPFSFYACCVLLNLDYEEVKEKLWLVHSNASQ